MKKVRIVSLAHDMPTDWSSSSPLPNMKAIHCRTRKGFFFRKKKTNKNPTNVPSTSPAPPLPHQSCQSCYSCMQHVISSCSTYVLSIIKIFRRVFVLQSRDKKSNSNKREDNSKSKSQNCHPCNVKCRLLLFFIITKQGSGYRATGAK